MSIEEENKAITFHFFEELNKGNINIADKLCSSDYVYHGTSGDMTLEQWKAHAANLLSAFPDLNAVVDGIIAEGDCVAVRFTIRGTHKGAYQGIAPTGRRITFKAIEIDRIAGDKFLETWIISDTLGLMQQLGAIPSQQKIHKKEAIRL